jgi:hypothetical protein
MPIETSGQTQPILSLAWVSSSSRWASTSVRRPSRRATSAKVIVLPSPVAISTSTARLPRAKAAHAASAAASW